MRINLNRSEIEEAIIDWVKNQGIQLDERAVTVDVTLTRNEATVDIRAKREEDIVEDDDDPPGESADSTKPLFNQGKSGEPMVA